MTDIEIIKSKINIVDLVREYVPELKKAGRNWTAKSPFRQERTPSFMVNEELGIFKDFGGDKAGDIFAFIQEIESLTFRETLEFLAKKAGIALKNNVEKNEKEDNLKKDIISINTLATEIFHFILTSHKLGQTALKYCLDRGLTLETIKEYKIGYSPNNLHLEKFIEKRLGFGIADIEITSSGLFTEKQGRLVDKFNDRLMFNIKNTKGEIVAFSGRVIQKDDQRPKYINSPETPVYKKSEILFNLYQAKSEIKSQDFVILTEGQIDTISSSRVGIRNIVAPLGTALTVDQLQIAKRYTDNLVLAFDNDEAGQKASIRAFELASGINLKTFVLDISDLQVKDIDELIQKDLETWKKRSRERVAFIDFQISKLAKIYDLANVSEKRKFISDILNFIAKLQDKIEQVSYIQKLSQIVNISEELLLAELESINNKSKRIIHNISQKVIREDELNSVTNISQVSKDDTSHIEVKYNPKELYLLALAYNFEEVYKYFIEKIKDKLSINFFETIDHKYFISPNNIPEDDRLIEEIAFLPLPESEADAISEFRKIFTILQVNYKKRQLLELANKVEKKEQIDDKDTSNEELSQAQEILKSMRL